MSDEHTEGIAIVGMAGRFPGAADLGQLWRNLCGGVESITFWSREELAAAGVDHTLLDDPRYVRAAGVLEGIEMFDAALFGFSPREADLLDPQHRVFLECCWEALENAGYDTSSYGGTVGIFGGMGMSKYLLHNLMPRRDVLEAAGPLQIRILNDKDFLASLAAFKLDLRGPSVSVQTACSTSLVATCLACQSLMSYQCDMVLAGGVSVSIPHAEGYLALESVTSPDGHCRAFDAQAQGTVGGSGCGVVVLKRLDDALADGDTIHAVIKGFATNNDGSLKLGYTAPGVEGQLEVVAMAQAVAGIRGDTITYLEAHGTGTPLGDPVEVEALTEVFRAATDRAGFCALGSIKTNVGHMDAAAGVASLIKTVLAIEHGVLPPSLNYETPNPRIDFASSPFYVNAECRPWKTEGMPRRAGVSSFAIGGVNAHVVLEEAPEPLPADPAAPWQLVPLSARSETALEAVAGRLADHLREHPDADIADLAWTLQVGRRALRHRRAVVCRDREDLLSCLEGREPRRVLGALAEGRDLRAAFLFPGLGNHYPGMGRDLYEREPLFREIVDECSAKLRPELGLDLRSVLYPEGGAAQASGLDLKAMLGRSGAERYRGLERTALSQPATFVVEYALARLLQSWGIQPEAMIGFSIGEYVAACLAGVLSLDDALRVVARRARLVEGLPEGAMLAAPISEEKARAIPDLAVAAVAGPELCILAGPAPAVAAAEEQLTREGHVCRRLQTVHAFHSPMMDGAVSRLSEVFRNVELRAPEIPFLSNVTGTWITAEQATDPAYWAEHLRRTVRFGDGLRELWAEPGRVLVEVGPGATLSSWALQHPNASGVSGATAIPTLRHALDGQDDLAFLLTAVGRLWLAGLRVDWAGLGGGQRRRRVPLPTYPFERQRYWIDATPAAPAAARPEPDETPAKRTDPADWFYLPAWKQAADLPVDPTALAERRRWLVIGGGGGEPGIASRLEQAGAEVVSARPEDLADDSGHDRLFASLAERGWTFDVLVDLRPLAGDPDRPFFDLLRLAQGLVRAGLGHSMQLRVVTSGIYRVTGAETLEPRRATVLGPCLVIPQEHPNLSCRAIDVDDVSDLAELLLAEGLDSGAERVVAYRHGQRWVRVFDPLRLEAGEPTRLRENGTYLITGGMGGVGLALAERLASSVKANLVLVGRTGSLEAGRLRRLEELGSQVLALAADVTDETRLREVVAEARTRFGRIDGVVHAAGVLPGGLIQTKTAEEAAAVLAPKVAGTLVLDRVLGDDRDAPPDFLLLCSSLTATAGAFGLVDHCAANAFLDAFAHYQRRYRVLSVDWDTWLEVGQAAQAARKLGLESSPPVPLSHLPPRPAADPHRERGDVTGAETQDRSDEAPTTSPLSRGGVEGRWERGTGGEDSFAHPLLTGELSAATHWVVDEHRLGDDGLLPGTAYLEMIRAAFSAQAEGGDTLVTRLVFARPLLVPAGGRREVRVVLENDEIAIESRRPGSGWESHAQARVERAEPEPAPKADLAALLARCPERRTPPAHAADTETGTAGLYFGPRWQGILQELHLGEGEGVAVLELNSRFASDLESFSLHPALLDAATGFVQALGDGSLYFPLGYEEVRIRGPLPARVYTHFRVPAGESFTGETIACDLSLLDESGTERVGIRGYTLRRFDPRALAERAAGSELQGVYDEGLLPAEGAEAFERLLAQSLRAPQVLVSVRDLEAVLRQAATLTREEIVRAHQELRSKSRVQPRPALHVPYAEPRNDAESALAALVGEVLRVEPVGVHDSFFDLGGDSLLAARLIGLAAERFDVQLSLRAVFESPSVAELALRVVQAQAERVDPDELAAALAEIQQLSPEELRELLAAEETGR